MSNQVLRILRDSYVKRRPEHLGHLPDHEKHIVRAGTEYPIASYAWADSAGDFDEHIKFALADQTISGFNTWFIFNRHAEVISNDSVVYPLEEQAAIQRLVITQATLLKRRPVLSSELSAEETVSVAPGTTFELHSYAYADTQGGFSDHIRIAIGRPEEYVQGLSTWYVYKAHAQVEFDKSVVYPITDEALPPSRPVSPTPDPIPSLRPTPTPSPSLGTPSPNRPSIALPGRGLVFLNEPILPKGNFTWGEATHGGSRIPRTPQEVDNIMALAKPLQQAREQLGRPFCVTSWYRPEPFNSKAGGVRNSQHLGGRAVDLVVTGMSGRQVANAVMAWWPGGVGIYPGNRRHIVHLDVGPRRMWGF
ncbi:MAG: DUF882 domain-containing protein [Kaiparowitsia implicata GSE-PSE-MK54-09C]|jgi:hypothetical protein|nr:DUF882 domain-containing protein [Kaiparowitsia implicata GSE-PSE-MK54-09C]